MLLMFDGTYKWPIKLTLELVEMVKNISNILLQIYTSLIYILEVLVIFESPMN